MAKPASDEAPRQVATHPPPATERSRAPSAQGDPPPRHRDDGGASNLPMKRRRKRERQPKKRRDNRKSRYDDDYVEVDERQNAEFAEYYRVQQIVRPEEHAGLLTTLAAPLPSSFRIVSRGAFGAKIKTLLAGEMRELFADVPDATPPAPIAWVPGGQAWSVSAPRQMLRRDNCLSKFHRFLVECTELGAVFRQEAVSMIPPLLLDAYAGAAVLDMCAAPGSKTGQMLEMFGAAENDASSEGPISLAQPGLVIANDADIKRCWMLTHQLKRFSVSQLLVTNHDAQFFPKVMMFDRVLCDVPCSGDGTLRKAPDIWRRWNCGMGMGLHRMQCAILARGIELLKPGGRLVYSTCSLNPIENEAVVAAALYRFGDDIELVDVGERLPGLRRRQGMTEWKVRDLSEEKMPFLRQEEEKGAADEAKVPEKETGDKAPADEAQVPEQAQNKGSADDAQVLEKMLDVIYSGDGSNETGDSVEKAQKKSVQEHGEQKPECASGDVLMEDALEREYIEKSPLRGWYTNFNQVRPRRRRKVYPSMFPPSKERLESGKCPLKRCLRLVPQDQNTGGFFVAVFEKKTTAELSKKDFRIYNQATGAENKNEEKAEGQSIDETAKTEKSGNVEADSAGPTSEMDVATEGDVARTVEDKSEKRAAAPVSEMELVKAVGDTAKDTQEKKGSERKGSRLITDDPLIGVENLNINALKDISDFFGLDYDECRHGLMTRGADGDKFKKVALVSPSVRDLLRISLGSAEASGLPSSVRRDRLRVVHAGVTLLERSSRKDSACRFRIVSDGARTLAGAMRQRVGRLDSRDFARLVEKQTLQISSISDWAQRRDIDASGSGSMVCVDRTLGEIAVVWKSRHALALLMPRTERNALMRRVGVGEAGTGTSLVTEKGDVAAGGASR